MSIFAPAKLLDDSPYPAHDDNLVGDTRTTLRVNYRWRRLILYSLTAILDARLTVEDSQAYTDLETQLTDMIADIYT